jgi:hypothetical protein
LDAVFLAVMARAFPAVNNLLVKAAKKQKTENRRGRRLSKTVQKRDVFWSG